MIFAVVLSVLFSKFAAKRLAAFLAGCGEPVPLRLILVEILAVSEEFARGAESLLVWIATCGKYALANVKELVIGTIFTNYQVVVAVVGRVFVEMVNFRASGKRVSYGGLGNQDMFEPAPNYYWISLRTKARHYMKLYHQHWTATAYIPC